MAREIPIRVCRARASVVLALGALLCGCETAGVHRDVPHAPQGHRLDARRIALVDGTSDGLSRRLLATRSGDFVLVGTTLPAAGRSAVVVARLSRTGDVVWQRTFGEPELDEWPFDVLEDRDGDLVVGLTRGGSIALVTLDPRGGVVREGTIDGARGDFGAGMVETELGFLVVGSTSGEAGRLTDLSVQHVDRSCRTLWRRTFGGDGYDAGLWVAPAGEGEWIVGGFTESSGERQRPYLARIDRDGAVAWARTLEMPFDARATCGLVDAAGRIVLVVSNDIVSTSYVVRCDTRGEEIDRVEVPASLRFVVEGPEATVIAGGERWAAGVDWPIATLAVVAPTAGALAVSMHSKPGRGACTFEDAVLRDGTLSLAETLEVVRSVGAPLGSQTMALSVVTSENLYDKAPSTSLMVSASPR